MMRSSIRRDTGRYPRKIGPSASFRVGTYCKAAPPENIAGKLITAGEPTRYNFRKEARNFPPPRRD